MKTILTPIDFSEITARVVDEAAELAQLTEGSVVLLHVVRPIQAAVGYDLDVQHLEELNASAEREADRRLGQMKTALHERGVLAQTVRLTGSPMEEILDQAEKLRASYIVMGSQGQTAFRDRIIGSAASAALKRAPCPVLIVPWPQKGGATSSTAGEAASKVAAL